MFKNIIVIVLGGNALTQKGERIEVCLYCVIRGLHNILDILDENEQILRIRLHHLSNHSSDNAARLLAGYLNETETI